MNTEQPVISYNDNRLGPYELRERLGEGGMAVIDKVWHTGLHRFEALKLPRQRGIAAADAAFIHRLLAEARIAAGLHHPHIVTIFNISEEDAPQPYFAMEFVDGRDMGKLLKERGALSLEDVLPMLGQVASALDYAHAHGVVHRDVKPSNILLKDVPPVAETSGGETLEEAPSRWFVKVVDFGISRALEDNSGTRLTKDGLFVGTPEYMAPEQANGGAVDGRTDLYALGVVAYEMLCGRPPFTAAEGASPISILIKQIHDAPRPPIEHLPQLSPAVNDAILKALAKDPAERFVTCAEFVTALAAVPPIIAVPPIGTATLAPMESASAPTGQGFEARPAAQDIAAITRPELRNERAATAVLTGADLEAGGAAKPPTRMMRPRVSTLLAGLGGLVMGGWLVHALGTREPEQRVEPRIAPAAKTSAVVKRTTDKPAPKRAPRAAAVASSRHRVQKHVYRFIPFARQVTRTQALLSGQRRVTRKGQMGKREVVLALTYQGQREVARQVVSSRVMSAPQTQLELLGVRRPAAAFHKWSRPAARAPSRPSPPRKWRPQRAGKRDDVEAIVGEVLRRGGGRGRGRGGLRWLDD